MSLYRRPVDEGGTIPSAILAGVVIGFLQVFVQISFASLVFRGELAEYLSSGISFILVGSMILGLVMAFTSSYRGTLGLPQDPPIIILAGVAAALVAQLPATLTSDEKFLAVMLLIVASTVLTGVLFLLMGLFKGGNLVRFIPHAVVGGLLAGTGGLLVKGALEVLTGHSIVLLHVHTVLAGADPAVWIPGVLFGTALLIGMRNIKGGLGMPIVLAGGVVLFYLYLLVTGMSISEAEARGYLIGPFPSAITWQPFNPLQLVNSTFEIIWQYADGIGAIFLISVLSLLLNASGVEVSTRHDLDLNRELKSAGLANILAGLGGSPVGYHALSVTVLGSRFARDSRLIAIAMVAIFALTLIAGTAVLALVPRAIVGGLVFFIGLTLVVEWLIDVRKRISNIDYALIAIIFVSIMSLGILPGIAIGILISVGVFITEYSRVRVIKNELHGSQVLSYVERPREQHQALSELSSRILIFKLQGYIFFGSTFNLLQHFTRRLRERDDTGPIQYLVLDFGAVQGFDSTLEFGFYRLLRLVRAHDAQLVLTGFSRKLRAQLERAGLADMSEPNLHFYDRIEYAIEWCENQLLSAQGLLVEHPSIPLQETLGDILPDRQKRDALVGYFERDEVPQGEQIITQGESSETLYYIESGAVEVLLQVENEQPLRLQKRIAGTVIGELSTYLHIPRTATVITAERSVLYKLTAESLRRMEADEPELAAAFHEYMARLLAERVAETSRAIGALSQ